MYVKTCPSREMPLKSFVPLPFESSWMVAPVGITERESITANGAAPLTGLACSRSGVPVDEATPMLIVWLAVAPDVAVATAVIARVALSTGTSWRRILVARLVRRSDLEGMRALAEAG